MKGDLGIVGAGLQRQIAAAARLRQLVAGKTRQLDERLGPPPGEAKAVPAVLGKKARTKPEGDRQTPRRQVEALAGVGPRHREILTERLRRLARGHGGGGRGPGTQQVYHLVAPGRGQVERGEISVTLRWCRDPALMFPPERLDVLAAVRLGRLSGAQARTNRRREPGAGAKQEAAGRHPPLTVAHGVPSTNALTSSWT